MSAWDIAGAVVWTPLALMFWATAFASVKRKDDTTRRTFLVAVPLTLAAIFCIARLCGAHA
jgi:hypothetical protein